MHGAIWEPNEGWILSRRNSSLLVLRGDLEGGVDILFLANVEVVVDEELSEGNLLLILAPTQFVSNLTLVPSVDHLLVIERTERQVVDRVSEVNLIATLHKLHDGFRAVM